MKSGTYRHSEEARRKMGEAQRGNQHGRGNKGRQFSEEHRRKLSEAMKGKKLSAETRRKMREAKRGKPHSEEHRRKISDANRGNQNAKGTKHPDLAERNRANKGKRGAEHPAWKGGRCMDSYGYCRVWAPNHPHTVGYGYVLEHRLVMEAHLGRTLLPSEVVHHINGDRADNRIENLMLFPSSGQHTTYHKTLREGKSAAI